MIYRGINPWNNTTAGVCWQWEPWDLLEWRLEPWDLLPRERLVARLPNGQFLAVLVKYLGQAALQPLPVLDFHDHAGPHPMGREVRSEFAEVVAQVRDG